MRIGVFIGDTNGGRSTLDDIVASARHAEELGFATAWLPQLPWSVDALVALACVGRATDRIELGTAVMPTYPTHPMAMARAAATVDAAAPGRFVLGIGPSHPVVIEDMFGLAYDHPAAHTREYVEVLRAAFAGGGHLEHDGEHFRVHAMFAAPGSGTVPVLVAALAPLMLRLAGEVADGTIAYWADETAIAEHIVPRITAAAAAPPRIVAGVPCAVVDDAGTARRDARRLLDVYTAIPTYQRILARGAAGHPVDVCAIGDEATVAARVRSYQAAGATDFMAAPLPIGDDPARTWARTQALLAQLAS